MISASLAFAGALAACAPTGGAGFSNGIGSELPATDVEAATLSLNEYFQNLCAQSGLAPTGASCSLPVADQNTWTLIVLQGMNDIDRRCDAYLAWLDDLKRGQKPALKQITDVQTATLGIVGVVSPGAGRAISIIGQSFGLLSKSVENYHSRLLIEIESSTINTVVIQARHRFRKETHDFVYMNRPAAEYALRSYLRICLPFAIETQINDLSTLGSRRQVQTSETTIHQSPSTAPIHGAAPFSPGTRVVRAADQVPIEKPSPRPRQVATGWEHVSSTPIDLPTAKAIQLAVCLTGSGKYGPKTEAALRMYQSVLRHPDFSEANWASRAVELNPQDVRKLRASPSCKGGAGNYLEKQIPAATLANIGVKLAEKYGLTNPPATLSGMRPHIRKWRAELGLDAGPGGMFDDQITPDFYPHVVPLI